jgi:hypothetical protein
MAFSNSIRLSGGNFITMRVSKCRRDEILKRFQPFGRSSPRIKGTASHGIRKVDWCGRKGGTRNGEKGKEKRQKRKKKREKRGEKRGRKITKRDELVTDRAPIKSNRIEFT